jgi:hypothetical protein
MSKFIGVPRGRSSQVCSVKKGSWRVDISKLVEEEALHASFSVLS